MSSLQLLEIAGKGNFSKTINKNVDSGRCLPLLEILALDQIVSHTFRLAWRTLTYSRSVGGLVLQTKKKVLTQNLNQKLD